MAAFAHAPSASADIRCLRFAGASRPVVLDAADEVGVHLRTIAPTWPVSEELEADSADGVRVTLDRDGYRVEAPGLVQPFTRLTAVSAACAVLVDLSHDLLETNPDWLCLHAAAVEIGGCLVVLAGDFHAGKSTLAAWLSQVAPIFCDDILPLVGEGTLGMGLGVAPRLRWPLPAAARRPFRRFVSRHAGPRDDRYAYLLPPGLVAHGRLAPIGAVILLDRRETGAAGFSAAARGDALGHLVRRNVARDAHPDGILDRLGDLLGRVVATRLHYADLDEAAHLIEARFSDWAGARSFLEAPSPAARPIPGEAAVLRPPAVAIDAHRPYRGRAGLGVRDVDGDLFLTSAAERTILRLNPIAAGIWRLLAEPTSAWEAEESLAIAFPDIDRRTLGADVGAFMADLIAAGLVEPASERSTAPRITAWRGSRR